MIDWLVFNITSTVFHLYRGGFRIWNWLPKCRIFVQITQPFIQSNLFPQLTILFLCKLCIPYLYFYDFIKSLQFSNCCVEAVKRISVLDVYALLSLCRDDRGLFSFLMFIWILIFILLAIDAVANAVFINFVPFGVCTLIL